MSSTIISSRTLFKNIITQFRYYSSKISSVNFDADYLQVNSGEEKQKFPLLWLRDNCQCEKCFHPDSQSRILHWKDFKIDTKPTEISTNNNDTVKIKWSDNHVSEFNLKWLDERSFKNESQKSFLQTMYKPKKIEWNSENFNSVFNNFNYKDIMEDNSCLHEWLKNMCVYGVALIKNVPSQHDSCRNIAKRVECIKTTHYGEEFIVTAKPGTTNVAYLSSNLQLHTDLPYYEYKPGANLLHCVEQAKGKGGENLLADGLYVANYLKKNDKRKYEILTKTPVDWEDIGQENGNVFRSIYRSPVIFEDIDGEIARINHSVPQRSSHFNLQLDKVKEWYEAQKTFVDLIYEHAATFKTSPGEILCFDNRRLLHGRTEYRDTSGNTRYVIGAYLDWDYIYSRYRVTMNK